MADATPAAVRFLPGSRFDLDFLAELYTQTFADYFFPCVVTTEELADYVRIEHLDLDCCPVMLVEDTPVGFATVGIRGQESYCKGFGVIVSFRGKGLSHILCNEMVRLAQEAGARRMSLGVIKDNTRAVRTYQKAGFEVARELISLEWQADGDESGPFAGSVTGDIIEASVGDLLPHFEDLHAVQPIWNRDLLSLQEIGDAQALAVLSGESPEAYVLFQVGSGPAEIIDLGARGQGRPSRSLERILSKLQGDHLGLVCHNEPADNPLLASLLANGFRETVRRYELKRSI